MTERFATLSKPTGGHALALPLLVALEPVAVKRAVPATFPSTIGPCPLAEGRLRAKRAHAMVNRSKHGAALFGLMLEVSTSAGQIDWYAACWGLDSSLVGEKGRCCEVSPSVSCCPSCVIESMSTYADNEACRKT